MADIRSFTPSDRKAAIAQEYAREQLEFAEAAVEHIEAEIGASEVLRHRVSGIEEKAFLTSHLAELYEELEGACIQQEFWARIVAQGKEKE